MMKKKNIIIPAALFAAVFSVSLICQRYTLIARESLGLFLFTPDWLKELLKDSLPLSNFVSSFLGQFYAEPVAGPMIPAAVITVIYLCINSFLSHLRIPFHNIISTSAALAVWCLTANRQSLVAMYTVLLISLFLWILSIFVRNLFGKEIRKSSLVEMAVALALIAGASIFVSVGKDTRGNEELARVAVNADRGNWAEVLKRATPGKVEEQPLLLPFAILAFNSSADLAGNLFRYPVTNMDCIDLGKDNSAYGDFIQALFYEMIGVPNEAIHQMFQFSTNFDHGMTHLSLRRLVRLNVNAGHYRMAVKYSEILRHNLFYRYQAERIIDKYGTEEDLSDTLETASSSAAVFTQDPVSDMMLLIKDGKNSAIVMDRFMACLLLECNLDDFLTTFYSFDWNGIEVPAHYQEALLLAGDIREGIRIDPAIARRFSELGAALSGMDERSAKALSEGTYWKYYYKNRQ